MKREFQLRAWRLPFYREEAVAFPLVFGLGFMAGVGLFLLGPVRGPLLFLPGVLSGILLSYVLWSVDHAARPAGTLTIENGEIRYDAYGRALRAFFTGPAPVIRVPLSDVKSMMLLHHPAPRGTTLVVSHARGRLFVQGDRLIDATVDDVSIAIHGALPQAAASAVDAGSKGAIDFQRKVARWGGIAAILVIVVNVLRVVLEHFAG